MDTKSFLVPGPMQKWVQKQVDTGGYANVGEYLSGLIKRDQQRNNEIVALQEAVDVSIESGYGGDLDIEAIKQKGRERSKANSKPLIYK